MREALTRNTWGQPVAFLTFKKRCERQATSQYDQVIRRAGLPKNNTFSGVIGRAHDNNRFRYFGFEIVELFEICKFVWPKVIFLLFIFVVVADPCGEVEQ